MDTVVGFFEEFSEIAAIALVILAGAMSVVAGIGLLRFPDSLQRLHAGAKPQVLGVIAMCTALVLRQPGLSVFAFATLIITFQMLTQPIAAQMVGRAVYRNDIYDKKLLVVDELGEEIDETEREARRNRP
jgi:multicomponent Na+:H+ antiporter subunit G